ncbi:hypothetical protein [Wenjunlia tyrosinilytica]|uniref:Uncharacterized protein n=1 Tax=Wenjunlia tyrosinilytica TaxID=1544741 RepID=A0A917ZT15_9ACTN|nr:hypothetical protein [Wenjunlia tyrosinilytica]GGO90033.1 hypothetical protein GCM10012280_34620 [Wenjunlia tyrosinilytica]
MNGARHILDHAALTGHHHVVHPQPSPISDLSPVHQRRGICAGHGRVPGTGGEAGRGDVLDLEAGVAAEWADERVWQQVRARLAVPGGALVEGPLIEKRVLDTHNYAVEPMSYGRLHPAGVSAHLIAPIGAGTRTPARAVSGGSRSSRGGCRRSCTAPRPNPSAPVRRERGRVVC